MKYFRYLFPLLLVLSLGSLKAQTPDPYLDDTYVTKEEMKQSQIKARAEAQARSEARLAAQAAAMAEQQKLIEAYKKRQREREIDAYNGYLSADDSLDLQKAYAQEYARAKYGDRTEDMIYGPYSSRLSRFYGDGRAVMYEDNLYDYSYASVAYRPIHASIYLGSSAYPWYSIYRHSPWGYGYSRYMWDYPYYDPYHYAYYSPWLSPYYQYYGVGYYGGLYGAYWAGYNYGYSNRRYNHYYRNEYSGAARNAQINRRYSPYEAYRSAGSSHIVRTSPSRYSDRAGYVGQTDYTGRGRSTFNTQGASYERNSEARSSSYSGGYSSESSSQRSSGASSARSRRGR